MNGLQKFILSFLLLLPGHLHAQYLSAREYFEVDYIRGCTPLSISLTNLNNSWVNGVSWSFTRGGDEGNETMHTYGDPGIFWIIYVGSGTDRPTRDSLRVEVLESQLPSFQLSNCANNRVAISFEEDDFYDEFQVNWTPFDQEDYQANEVPFFDFQVQDNYTVTVKGLLEDAPDNCITIDSADIKTLNEIPEANLNSLELINGSTALLRYELGEDKRYNINQLINASGSPSIVAAIERPADNTELTGLNNFENYYCYFISTTDLCSNEVFNTDTICSVATNLNTENNLIKAEGRGFIYQSTEIAIAKNNEQFFTTTQDSGEFITLLNDDQVECGNQYCYQFSYVQNGVNSIGLNICDTAFSVRTPELPQNISATFENKLRLVPEFYDENIINSYLYHSEDGFEAVIDTFQGPVPEINTHISGMSYKIVYEDFCANISLKSQEVSPVELEATVDQQNNINLSWSEPKGWNTVPIDYTINVSNLDSILLRSLSANNTDFSDEVLMNDPQNLKYQITAYHPEISGINLNSNVASVVLNPQISIPDAFTPNFDGINDGFTFESRFISHIILSIYNRWGQKIFYQEGNEIYWNGIYKNEKVPAGIYIYRIIATDEAGREFTYEGKINVLTIN